MLLKELGQTGVFIPEVGIGTWNYHAGPGPLRKGLEAGSLFIDTAESYGTEEAVGEAVRGWQDRVFIATKVSPEHFHTPDLWRSVDASLRRLGVDAIDLLQLHAPNPAIPIEETMSAITRLIDTGKVRFAGVSNFSVAQLEAARRAFGARPIVSNQVRYNLADRTIETDLLPYCQANHITVIAYSPLARSLNRIRDCDPGGVIDRITGLTGRSPAQIAINWCLWKTNVVAIPKGNSEEHVLDNCAASGWRLDAEHMGWLDSQIQYRRRGAFEGLMRRWMPKSLHTTALTLVSGLPRALRRRLT